MGSVNDLGLYRVVALLPGVHDRLSTIEVGRLLERLPGVVIDAAPPHRPEGVQVSFDVGGLSAPAAEMRAQSALRSHGLTVLEISAHDRGQERAA